MTSPEIQANLDRSNASLQASKLLKDAGLLDDSVSRAYYSVFHAASALLLSKGLTFSSHVEIEDVNRAIQQAEAFLNQVNLMLIPNFGGA